MVKVELNKEMVSELMSLTDEEMFQFKKNNKQFVILNKTEYNKINAEAKGFRLLKKVIDKQ